MFILCFYFWITNTRIYANNVYTAIDACVFDPMETYYLDSRIMCSSKCEIVNCKAFRYDSTNRKCILYALREICQSNTMCSNVTIFVNKRYNNEFASNSKGAAFKLFIDINYPYFRGPSSIYGINKRKLATPILSDNKNGYTVVVGTYQTSKLITLPTYDLVKNLNSKHVKLGNNIVRYLTGGKCVKVKACYHNIHEHEKYKGIQNQVFGLIGQAIHPGVFLAEAVKSHWHFVLGGSILDTVVDRNWSLYADMYGICLTKMNSTQGRNITGNICKIPKKLNLTICL